jgi:hypothetical protein
MQIPTLNLKPPPPYGDLRELEATFAAIIPVLTPQLASLLGKRTPKSNQKETRALKKKLRRFLLASRPYLLGLQALKPGPDQHKCSYALLEGLLKEHFRALGKRVSDNQDAFQVLLRQTERTVRSPKTIANRFPAYSATRKAVYELLFSLYRRVDPLEISRKLEEWYASKSCKKYLHSCLIWPTLIRKSRQSKPARLTLRLANQLSEEYRMGCSFMEDRLRLLVWLDEIAQGSGRPWIEQESRKLFQLLEAATISGKLTWVPPLLDRHVRNALAHGQPELNLDAAECLFHDRTVTVTWSMNEFFEKTKQLTLATRALMELESIMQMLQTQSLVTTLWQQALR